MNTREWSLRESLITEVGFESLFTAKFSNPTKIAVNQKSVCCPTWACVTLLVLCSRPSKQKETKKTKAKSTKIVWTKGNWCWMFLTLSVVSCRPLEITDSVAALLLSRGGVWLFLLLPSSKNDLALSATRDLEIARITTSAYKVEIYHLLCSKLQFTLRWGGNNTGGRYRTSVAADLQLGAKSRHLTCLLCPEASSLTHTVCIASCITFTDCTGSTIRRPYIQSSMFFFFISEMVSAKLSRRAGGQLFPRWNGGEGLGNRLRLSVYRLNAVD